MRTKQNLTFILLFLLFILLGCAKDEIDVMSPLTDTKTFSSVVGPDGKTISSLNNNVTIEVPPGAVTDYVEIKLSKCDLGTECNFLLDMIRIEPELNFKVPVTLQFKYDGELICSDYSPEGREITICHWGYEYSYLNRYDYMNRSNVECIACQINTETKTISFITQKTGLFALSIKDNPNTL